MWAESIPTLLGRVVRNPGQVGLRRNKTSLSATGSLPENPSQWPWGQLGPPGDLDTFHVIVQRKIVQRVQWTLGTKFIAHQYHT